MPAFFRPMSPCVLTSNFVCLEIRAIEGAAEGAARGAGQHRQFADPRVGGESALERLVAECQSDADDRQQDPRELPEREPLAAQCRADERGEQGERREDQRRARRRYRAQPEVEQRDQDPELRDAEERDRQQIVAREIRAGSTQEDRRHQTARAEDVAQEREGRGAGLIDDEPRGHHRRADLDTGRSGRGRGPDVALQRLSSQVSPTRLLPKLRCGSRWMRRNPAVW